MADCRHQAVPGLTLELCSVHSDPTSGVSVWTWTHGTPSRAVCPCADADRFVVAGEDVAERWRGSVDVVLVTAQSAVRVALLVPMPSGSTLVVVPVPSRSRVFRTMCGAVVVDDGCAGVCGVCLYPWLVSGLDPFGLARPAWPRRPPESVGR